MRGGWLRGLVCAAALLSALPAVAQDLKIDEDTPVLLSADEVIYDEELGVVVAKGNVEISQNDNILLADTVTYNERADTVTASGNVSLLDADGNVVFADYVQLTDDMRDGVITNVRLLLDDRSKVAAAAGRRIGGTRMEMDKAVYSPCELCEDDPSRAPLWQIKAVKVVHDQTAQRVVYKDAWLEIYGVPVVYTPYFSHPDPSVKRQSGFLAPSFGLSENLGYILTTPYFWAIGPDKDFTFSPIFTTRQSVVAAGEYRQRVVDGNLRLAGSATIADREDVNSGIAVTHNNQFRGHIDADGLFDINEHWRWGFNADRSTDKTYLRLYDFSSARTLTSRLYAEGFHGRNHLSLQGVAFQGTREGDDNSESPIVLPLIDYNFVGEPSRYGGFYTFDAGIAALTRIDGRDSRRLSMKVGWTLPYIAPAGDVYTLTASLQGDAYWVNGVDPGSDDPNPKGSTEKGFAGRIFPQLTFDWRYPFVRRQPTFSQVFEPIFAVSLAPNGGNPGKIPNEDSLDIEFDETNLFSASRFTGLDRVDSGQRVSYGFKWSLYGNGGGSTSVFVGQSYQLNGSDEFPEGSGLDDQLSDIVGRIQVSPNKYLDLLYRFRYDVEEMKAQRNEVRLTVGPPALNLGLSYFFLNGKSGAASEFADREELYGIVKSQLTDNWSAFISARRDMEDGRMLSVGGGIGYEDECFEIRTSVFREEFSDDEIDPGTTFLLSINFKTLGNIETSF